MCVPDADTSFSNVILSGLIVYGTFNLYVNLTAALKSINEVSYRCVALCTGRF